MQISLSFDSSPEGLLKAATVIATMSAGLKKKAAATTEEDGIEADEEVVKKRYRRTKAEIEAAKKLEEEDEDNEDEESEDETDDDGSDSDEEDEEDESEEEDEAPPAKKTKPSKLTLDGDVIPAFQAYAKKHSREKAGKILAKYKAASVRNLPADKYAEILKLLK